MATRRIFGVFSGGGGEKGKARDHRWLGPCFRPYQTGVFTVFSLPMDLSILVKRFFWIHPGKTPGKNLGNGKHYFPCNLG